MVWWRDPMCGYEWQDTPRARGQVRSLRCPSCRSLRDSLAWQYPEVADQWSPENPVSAWHVRPNGALSFVPSWVCVRNPTHIWKASTVSRINGGQCPHCVGHGKSAVELTYHAAAVVVFGSAASGEALYDGAFTHRRRWVVDILVTSPAPAVVIEFDGAYWHRDKTEVDTEKSLDLLAAGYAVVRLRETPLPGLPVTDPRYVEITVRPGTDPEVVMHKIHQWAKHLPDH